MANSKKYDVIVVGGGHAGCEAAYATAKMGLKTLLVTLSVETIALMPCNPSIGGSAKSHLVFEIDALGGLMGKIADKTAIQKRILNQGKGPAVHALRAQVNRFKYSRRMISFLEGVHNLAIVQGEVTALHVNNQTIKGIVLNTGLTYKAKSVILTTGTYLRSKVIIGDFEKNIGPNEITSTFELSENLHNLGFNTMRFKTGTPPRLDKRTLDYAKLEVQLGDADYYTFSFSENIVENPLPKIPCYLTHTSKETKKIIEKNLHRSPLLSGIIEGVGPRYCPSIEDKTIRFPDKNTHHLFIEPEGEDVNEMYLQGFSTSLPADVQEEMVHSITGLEKAHIMKLAYAIEYDVIHVEDLHLTLESKKIENLYFAGQINGTSGYEEAAAQGLIAGINSGLKLLKKESFILRRSESYIGVLIDDLVTKGTKEPYRMFTARAEYRLLLRQSNSDRRLTEKAYELDLINYAQFIAFKEKIMRINAEVERLKELSISLKNEAVKNLLKEKNSTPLQQGIKGGDLLKRPEIKYMDLERIFPPEVELSYKEKEEVELLIKYEGYIKKQIEQVEKFNKGEKKKIPHDLIDYNQVKGLPREAIDKLNQVKPISVGQASRISGITPADIQVLLIYLEHKRRS
ncbi:tRNA uridine(34) 5-carboxymethylaminomethyl synthesis enzyme MnmG [endosymbiont 'TC1' of Trimyema compressum]|uniref:tRNA uridine-5-carboxymethylaminomethyl(34) synthesis enzyme MnmG n=1 Tax=endosymbiont 'TC1' of Trimyema compressum TaxID=243899 RepID=UPI0007F0D461|nr:tRNA uridine-5-carboxymethylaminomethyl(34) synthesis enzyme MnmG [endosymbiont 'TC1' of Trimyema compressum]AMP21255.1 tRNA uridine(34) 5-carboxymethylaminomethyl synthesis enzyme MnmG [endosymbiont 'TC1' of Trimyema compressum]